MAGRDGANGNKHSRNAKAHRRRVVTMGGAAAAFLAAAAMATGSAAPAKADLDDLLDPILQPILTQVIDSLSSFDPTLATDLTSWTDTLLADLNSLDTMAAAAATGASAAASPASDPTSGTYDIPISIQEDTEPTVQASIDGGADQTVLVDTGSSGLVIPYTDLGSTSAQQLENLIDLGFPTGINESAYSGGVDYIYLEYDNATVDYGDGALTTTNTPIDVEVYSWDPGNLSSLFTNDAFQNFDTSNDVTGVLGIGDNTAGPTESPLQADGYTGVLVDLPQDKLIVSPTNPFADDIRDTVSGAPNTSGLTEVVTNSDDQTIGSATVSDDVDSGGVYGTIPSSIDSSTLAQGDTVTVSDDGTYLYAYNVETDNDGTDEAPDVTSGTSIDSGVEPFLQEPIYIDYTDDTMTFDAWGT